MRNRSDEHPAASHEFYRDIIEISQDLIWECNLDGCFTYTNSVWEKVAGYSPREISGKRLPDFQSPPDAERSIAMLSQILDTGAVMDFETVLQTKSGKRIHLSINARLAVDEAGRPLCIRGMAFDITEKKLLEEAVGLSENRFRTLFMSITDGFYLSEVIYDDRGDPIDYRYLEVNPVFERILGLPHEKVIGKRYKELVPVDTTDWLNNYFRVAVSGVPSTYEFYSAEYRMHFETYSYRIVPDQICVFVRNVTERKNTEKALQNIQKLDSLGVLAGGIAHDFNNLLGGIFGYIDLAIEESDNTEVTSYLTKAMEAISRARDLTRQLLTFAKGGEPVRTTGELFPFIGDIAVFALSGSNVSCDCTAPPGLWRCHFDRTQISQVISNLVINAQQAMPGGGRIELSAANITFGNLEHSSLQAGCYVRISVCDNGCGIPHESLHRIFDPFYSTKPTGYGLGLAICHSIILRHHGSIEVDSEPGKGSTFTIYLPASLEAPATVVSDRPAHHTGSGTVILMDDEEMVRETVGAMFTSFGYSVVCFQNGDEVVRFLAETAPRPYGIAFMMFDMTVPGGKGGKEIIAEVTKSCPDIPVFVASGYADDPIMSHPREFGFTASICKPFTRKDLGLFLASALERDSSG